MLNPYKEGDVVSFVTNVRNWNPLLLKWISFPYAHASGTVYLIDDKAIVVETKQGHAVIDCADVLNAYRTGE